MDKGEESLFYTRAAGGGARKTTKGQSTTGRSVVVEEKVDGANLGISINAQWRLRVQNRSTRSSTHKQFSTLDAWLEAHSSALFQVMEPERHVLFREWLYAKHSIHYTRLPDYFLAFDLYDWRTGSSTAAPNGTGPEGHWNHDCAHAPSQQQPALAAGTSTMYVCMHAGGSMVAPRINYYLWLHSPPPPQHTHERLVFILRALFSCMLGCEALRHTLCLLWWSSRGRVPQD